MKKLVIVIALLSALASIGCEQYVTRQLGGESTINLPCGQKLVNATWKDTDLWYLTRPMRADEKAERITFTESSTYGVMQGTVTFRECR